MGQVPQNVIPWMDETDEWGASDPSTLVMENSDTTILVSVIVGVIAAVVLLFTLALLIDCKIQKPGSTSNRITGKTVVLPKRTKFPQFIRNSAMNDENITFANQMCTVNSMTLPAASRIEENC